MLSDFQKMPHVKVAPQVYYALLIILADRTAFLLPAAIRQLLGYFGDDLMEHVRLFLRVEEIRRSLPVVILMRFRYHDKVMC